MERIIVQGQWDRIKGKVHHFWARLTEDEVDQLDGRYETLSGKIQAKYGLPKEEAEDQVRNFLTYCERERLSGKNQYRGARTKTPINTAHTQKG